MFVDDDPIKKRNGNAFGRECMLHRPLVDLRDEMLKGPREAQSLHWQTNVKRRRNSRISRIGATLPIETKETDRKRR
jgi:hypothetical protein